MYAKPKSGILSAISHFTAIGFLPVAHDEEGEPYNDNWTQGKLSIDEEEMKEAHGLSLAMGYYGKLVALHVSDYKNNEVYNTKIIKDIELPNTCTVIMGDNAYFIYKYIPECRDVKLSSKQCNSEGVWFQSDNCLVPYYGLQPYDIRIGWKDIKNPSTFSPIPCGILRNLIQVFSDIDKRPTIWLPVGNYSYYNNGDVIYDNESEISIATSLATMRFHLSYVSNHFATNRSEWEIFSKWVLYGGPMMVRMLHDFTFQSDIKPCISKADFDKYCKDFYNKHPEYLKPDYNRVNVSLQSICHCASMYNPVGYSNAVASHCNSQMDMRDPFTSREFMARNIGSVHHLNVEHAVTEIIKDMHPHTRYIPMIDSFAIRHAIGEPISIVKRDKVSHHKKYIYVKRTKSRNGKDPSEFYEKLDPYSVYANYSYGVVDVAISVPYLTIENPYEVMNDYVPTGTIRRLNTFPGYIAQSCKRVGVEVINVILNHIKKVLARDNEDVYRWILGWLKLKLAYPRYRCETVPVLLGRQRCGKSIFLNFLVEKVFGRAISIEVTGVSKLTGRFNGTIEGKSLIIVNEMPDTDDKSNGNDRFEVLKSLITERSVCIEPKGKECYSVPNFASFIIATNNPYSIPIKRDDSRYVFFDCSDEYVSVSSRPYDDETQDDIDKCGKASTYFTKLHNIFNSPKSGDYFYSYILSEVPDEWVNRAKTMIKTSVKFDIMRNFETKPYLYYQDLESGIHSLRSNIISKGPEGNCVKISDLFDDYQYWCKTRNYNSNHSMAYFSKEFPLPTKCIKLTGKSYNVRYIPPTFTIDTDVFSNSTGTPGRQFICE